MRVSPRNNNLKRTIECFDLVYSFYIFSVVVSGLKVFCSNQKICLIFRAQNNLIYTFSSPLINTTITTSTTTITLSTTTIYGSFRSFGPCTLGLARALLTNNKLHQIYSLLSPNLVLLPSHNRKTSYHWNSRHVFQKEAYIVLPLHFTSNLQSDITKK